MGSPHGKKKLRNAGARRGRFTCGIGHKLNKINKRCHPHKCEHLRLNGEPYYTGDSDGCLNEVPYKSPAMPRTERGGGTDEAEGGVKKCPKCQSPMKKQRVLWWCTNDDCLYSTGDIEDAVVTGFDYKYLSNEKCEFEVRQPQPNDDGSCGEDAIALCWWDDEQKDSMKVCSVHLNQIMMVESGD